MESDLPTCPSCRRELAAFVPRRRWVCVYCGVQEPFAEPARTVAPLPRRAPLGPELDLPFTSWEHQRFTVAESIALMRLKLARERLLRSECDVSPAVEAALHPGAVA